jgi:glycosyltransferase involved in cell wall biosynthesis
MYNHNQDLLHKICLGDFNKHKGLELTILENGSFHIVNSSNKNLTINITRLFFFIAKNKILKFVNNGILKSGQCYFNVGWTVIPLNASAEFPVNCIKYCKITLTLKPKAELILSELRYELLAKSELENFTSKADTLVISPGYPSSSNLYSCGFVHTSSKGYVSAGLNVDVFCIDNSITTYRYQFDQLNIFTSNLVFLKNLINKSNYKRVIIHFLDEKFVDIINSVILYYGIKIYVYIHGAEVMHHNQKLILTGYDGVFHKFITDEQVEARDRLFRKYSRNPNIKWLFVSNWVKEEAEKMQVQFANYSILPNGLDTNIFRYCLKTPEHRLNIFTIRRFDNINNYAMDLVINTILFLKDREFFDKLNFYIYGDGPLFNKFQSQVPFANVKFTKSFFTQSQISELHKNCGIIFHPTRVDSMGCSSLEGVCSGLVLVSSNTAAVPEFISPSYGTLSNDVENAASYAEIIENLYNDPDRFLELSKKMSEDISSKFSRDIILAKELEFFRNEKPFYISPPQSVNSNKILSICIPVYNIEKYLTRCLNSILSCDNKHLLELIIVNDGSTDNSAAIARKFQQNFPSIVVVIDQENCGHGGAIMTGLKKAIGKYFRIIDGDDWVNTNNLDYFITSLAKLDVDLVLTEFSCDLLNEGNLTKHKLYGNIPKGKILNFDGIIFPYNGPVLATSTYMTSVLKNSNFKITEKCSYVDMEFNAYALQEVSTVLYLDLFIYHYFIGRVDQSISRQSFKNRYKDHEQVIFNLLHYITTNQNLSNYKRKLITDKLLSPMLNSHFLNLLVNLRDYKEVFNVYKKLLSHNRASCNNTYFQKADLKIAYGISKTIVKRLSSIAFRLLPKLLLIPHDVALHILQIMHMYDIYFFDKYARSISKMLILPYKIASYVRRKF